MLLRNTSLFVAASIALAGCASDGNSGSGGGSSTSGNLSLLGITVPGLSGLSNGELLQEAPELGVSGGGGLAEDLLGQDVVASLVSSGPGPVPGVVAGGEDGILGSVADPLAPLLPDLPALPKIEAPVSLGITGPGGLVEDFAGQDVLGAALGAPGGMVPTNDGLLTQTLAGGDGGILGNVVPSGASSSLPLPGLLALPTGATLPTDTNQLTQVLTTLTNILPK
ncbi:hypothetical protein [Parvibaculum sp.]|uniref:hypothetical protein n=1 Tax=Parvibaculum sp. TaxID=2024848 RepID=UPI002C810E49|nr:hypothetical protein [Parvibaculum sp.]HUD51911.1 hypothetical protein [Parvibaculum sp.]